MNRNYIAAIALLLILVLRGNALEMTVTPGALATNMVRLESTRDSEVKLIGAADVRDLRLLSRISDHVTTLDLSELTIAPYTYTAGNYQGRTSFASGELIADMLAGTQVRQLTLPARATRIGAHALANTRLTSLTVPANIKTIDSHAFAGSRNLTSVTIQGNPVYGAGVFADCSSLVSLTAVDGIATVTEEMFRNCRSLTAMPSGVRTVGAQAFRGTGLTAANLSGVTQVGDYAFAEIPALASVTIDSGTEFGNSVFYGDSGLQSLSEWISPMSQAVVAHAGLTGPLAVNSAMIEEGAFANNPRISSLILGSAVTGIKANAFRNDYGLNNINVVSLGRNIPEADPLAFSGLESDNGKYPIKLMVLESTVDAWKTAPVWQNFEIAGVSGVTSIDDASIQVSATRSGNLIHIHSSVPMTTVGIYSQSGVSYFTGGEGEYEVSVRIPTDEVTVVRIIAGRQVKIFKLR